MKFRLPPIVITLATLFPFVLQAQNPALSITAASLNIDPTATDSYNLQGAFSGLNFSTAQSVTLQVGPFSATIPIGNFVQQPANVFTYQDSTGQTPYWISSLTIDNNAGTFAAQATGVVLSGIENPFAVQLATDTASSCSMARVQQSTAGAYQLTAGDGANEPCQIPDAPVAEPPVISAGAAANVTFTLDLLPNSGLDSSGLQLFVADGNAQPSGGPICALSANADGTYSCTASFNQAAPGTIPMVVQGTAMGGTQTILSAGFSVQVIGTPGDADSQQISDIQNAMSQAVQNVMQYGDTAYSRILTLQALRTLLQPQAGLTGQPVELSPDGLSIGVRSSSGMMVMDYLINDDPQAPATSAAMLAPRLRRRPAQPRISAGGGTPPLQCGQYSHDIVQNDQVLLWDPGRLFFEGDDQGPRIIPPLMESKCPPFAGQLVQLPGAMATHTAIGTFPNYGTIIMATHGDVDINHRSLIITGESTGTTTPNYADGAQLGASCFSYGKPFYLVNIPIYPHWGCFVHVYASYIQAQTGGLLTNSVIYAGLCYGASGDMAAAFTPAGSNNAYFAFGGVSTTGDTATIGSSIFTSMVNQHLPTSAAYAAAPPPVYSTAPLYQFGDVNLAYLGNPRMSSPQGDVLPLPLGPGSVVNLNAQVDGASECGGIMNYRWTNTAQAGHLTSADGGQDNFTNTDAITTYTADQSAQSVDIFTVQFLPDLNNPPAAMACSSADVTTQQILHIVFDGSGTWDLVAFGNEYTADLSWRAAWDMPLNPSGGGGFEPALPGTRLTGTTTADAPDLHDVCEGPPVVNPTHDGITTAMPQSPYLGVGPYSGTPTLLNMWAETFGGDDYSICGGGLATVGDYGPPLPGYPGWDTPAGIVMFQLDLTQWYNQPDHTMKMPVNFAISPVPGGYDTGEGTQVTGTLTFTSRTVTTPNANAAPSQIQQRAKPAEKK